MKVVLTAATRWEAQPLVRAWGLTKDKTGWRGSVGGCEVLLVETGVGPEKAKAALSLVEDKPDLVISSGFAGALQAGMKSGDLVADPHGAPITLVEAARKAAEGVAPIHMGKMISVDQVLADPAMKRALGDSKRAVAVDMESAAVRQWAGERGAEFVALRVVLDAVDQPLPAKVPDEMASGGGALPLIRYAFQNFGDIPLMLKLFLAQSKGMRSLITFLKSFLLNFHIDTPARNK